MLLEWEIAKRYLKSKRKESFIAFISWFALIGIAMGVAVLIIVMSVMNGFKKQIISNLIGANGHVFVVESGNKVNNYQSILDSLKKVKHIDYASPSIESQAMLAYKSSSKGVYVHGLTFQDLSKREVLFRSLSHYNLKSFDLGADVVIIGRIIARDMGISLGDNINLISADGYSTVMGSFPKFGGFKVIGILDTGMFQYDSAMLIIPFKSAQSFFNYSPSQTQKIDIFLDTPDNALKVSNNLYSANSRIHYVQTWQDANRYLMNALDVERNVMFLILSLVILIATFNIVSGLVMLVRSKTKEVAILRTIGFSKKSISLVFLFIGIRVGFIGTFFGSILGVIFSLNIEKVRSVIELLTGTNLFAEEVYFLSKLPSDVQSMQVILVIFISLVFSILSALYPAYRGSKIKPVEGLKYD